MKENFKFLMSIIILKICLLFYIFNYQATIISDNFIEIFTTNDYSALLGPINNFIENGTYELENGSGVPYTGRLPGYIFPFIFFRYIFSVNTSILLLVIYQIFFSIIASYLLFKIIKTISKNLYVSYLIFIIYNLFSFLIPWELWTVPESLSVSYYIISIYFLIKFFYESNKLKYLIFSGLFLAMVFFLRGFLFFNFLSVLLVFLFKYLNFNSIKYYLIFIFPFIFFESLWITRNYISTDKFIPLTSFQVFNNIDVNLNKNYRFDDIYKPTVLKLRKLISCWGGVNVHFYKNSEMSFFLNNEKYINNVFPEWIFNCGISKEMLFEIQDLLNKSFDSSLSHSERCIIEHELLNYIDNVINRFHYNSIFQSFLSRFSRVKNLIYNNVLADWPIGSFDSNNLIVKLYKLFILAIYMLSILLSLLAGFTHLILRFFNSQFNAILSIIFLNSIFVIFVFSFIIDVAEFKYSAIIFINSIILCCFYFSKFLKIEDSSIN